MAEVKKLPIIPALYDVILYFECAQKDWIKGAKKTTISGDGGLVNLINWNSTYSYDPNDKGGKTLFGVTEDSWKEYVKKYPEKGYNKDINTMGKNGWMDQVEWYWSEKCSAGACANYACAFMMLQMVWMGFSADSQKILIRTLKENADITDYEYITKGSNYKKIADATHAFTDPMVAFNLMKKIYSSYLVNISTPNKTNNIYRMGWLNRVALSFTPYGLYIPITMDGKAAGLNYNSTLDEWEATSIRLAQNNTKGFVKILDWGATPESIDKITSGSNDYIIPPNNLTNSLFATNSSGAYGGCGNIQQLGNYSNNSNGQNVNHQTNSREDVFNTLLGGSYSPNSVKKCMEFLTTDKIKNPKIKSEA